MCENAGIIAKAGNIGALRTGKGNQLSNKVANIHAVSRGGNKRVESISHKVWQNVNYGVGE